MLPSRNISRQKERREARLRGAGNRRVEAAAFTITTDAIPRIQPDQSDEEDKQVDNVTGATITPSGKRRRLNSYHARQSSLNNANVILPPQQSQQLAGQNNNNDVGKQEISQDHSDKENEIDEVLPASLKNSPEHDPSLPVRTPSKITGLAPPPSIRRSAMKWGTTSELKLLEVDPGLATTTSTVLPYVNPIALNSRLGGKRDGSYTESVEELDKGEEQPVDKESGMEEEDQPVDKGLGIVEDEQALEHNLELHEHDLGIDDLDLGLDQEHYMDQEQEQEQEQNQSEAEMVEIQLEPDYVDDSDDEYQPGSEPHAKPHQHSRRRRITKPHERTNDTNDQKKPRKQQKKKAKGKSKKQRHGGGDDDDDDDYNDEEYDDDVITLSIQKVPTRSGGTKRINAIDVVSQICSELFEKYAEKSATSNWSKNALSQYREILDQRFCKLVDAIDVNHSIYQAMKRTEARRNYLRSRLIQIRQDRAKLQVEMQNVRDDYHQDREAALKLAQVGEFADDVMALRQLVTNPGEPKEPIYSDMALVKPIVGGQWGAYERIKSLADKLASIDQAS